MDPIIGAGLASAVGSVASGALSAFGGHKANKANIASARESMRWQEEMSNSSYQRAADDMRKAGLNPILALSKGGASTPSGPTSTSQNELSESASSAKEVSRMAVELAKIRADTALTNALARKADADIANSNMSTASTVRYQNALGDQADSQIAVNALTARNILQNLTLKSPMTPIADLAHSVSKMGANFARSGLSPLESFGRSAGNFVSGVTRDVSDKLRFKPSKAKR